MKIEFVLFLVSLWFYIGFVVGYTMGKGTKK